MSLGSPLQLLRGRGHCSQRSPRRVGCSRRSSAPPRGLLQRPPGPWGGRVCRGAAGTSAGEGRGSRRDRRTRGALPPSHPPSRVRGPRQPPCPPLTLAPRLQSAEGSGAAAAEALASYWLASPATRAPASLSSIPSAGRGSRKASPGAPGIRGSCPDPATASERRKAREPARRRRGPQGSFP